MQLHAFEMTRPDLFISSDQSFQATYIGLLEGFVEH